MLQIKKTSEKQDTFFTEMGMYFSRKEIIKEMDCQIYSNCNMDWYIAYEDKNIVGFVSVEELKKYYYIDNFYILREYRKKGYGKQLFIKMFEDIEKNKKIKLITRNGAAKKIFESVGMRPVSKKGRYVSYEK